MGGGLLETNNQLERFTKNKKSKKLTYSIIGLLLIIGSITLFKTYAFFEEKQEFNIIRGKIPNFIENDVFIALRLNGEIVDEIPKGKAYKVDVTCNNAKGSWNYETWKLDVSEIIKKAKCEVNFKTDTSNLFYASEIGDYISYTPVLEKFDIENKLTGCTGETSVCNGLDKQIINPSELNLWRVIRKNNDGTLDLVSEYVSSTNVYFYGKEGYRNYIGALNIIARSYETPDVTIRSRYIGYDGQTEMILDDTVLNSKLFPETTSVSNSPKRSKREALGGGDLLYATDEELIKAACGSFRAKDIMTKSIEQDYWLGSRYFNKSSDGGSLNIRIVHISGGIYGGPLYYMGNENDIRNNDHRRMIRPIVTLKSEIQSISGNGKSETSAWKIN